MKAQFYKDKRGEWRWRIKARNGKIVAESGEGYIREAKARGQLDKIIDAVWFQTLVVPESEDG